MRGGNTLSHALTHYLTTPHTTPHNGRTLLRDLRPVLSYGGTGSGLQRQIKQPLSRFLAVIITLAHRGFMPKIPTFSESSKEYTVDLSELSIAESSFPQIELVNPRTAGTLLTVFIKAISALNKAKARIQKEIAIGEKLKKRRKSVILLDEATTILKEKGLTNGKSPSGSADLREAIVETDAKYSEIEDKLGELQALADYCVDCTKTNELAYHAVKKLMDNSPNFEKGSE